MNFNLKPMKLFELLKINFKGILKFTTAITLVSLVLCGLFAINIAMYAVKSASPLYILTPITLTLIILFLMFVALIYFVGFHYEVLHNIIEEKDEFMPTAKGRFNEYMVKGAKSFVGGLVYGIIIFFVTVLMVIPTTYTRVIEAVPLDMLQLIFIFVMFFLCLSITPFFVAYAHTFKIKSFFDEDNFTILKYAFPEFAYSYILTQIFVYATSMIFMLAFLFVLLIAGIIMFGISLTGNLTLLSIVAIIMIGILLLSGSFALFLISVIATLFSCFLYAQSYNYGKYFLCKGEAPIRTTIETLLPILIILLFCISSILTNRINENLNKMLHKNPPNVMHIMQKWMK